MMVGGSQEETLYPCFVLLGTRQQGVPVILRELVLSGGFDPVSPNFTIRDVTTELSGPRLTSCSYALLCSSIMKRNGFLVLIGYGSTLRSVFDLS
ncbi:unnamed protein product [Schistosoma curassoni]|uniref:Uncharacterized protein n=1 Tax=Schistosoma curassoni TaxID=6186 RepID=A0A183JE56_9TREM|nr:unnamed protein product [Schistosoma curassoni]